MTVQDLVALVEHLQAQRAEGLGAASRRMR